MVKWNPPHLSPVPIAYTCMACVFSYSLPPTTVTVVTSIPEKTECCCNGNPMLRELSINLLLTIGSVWSLKIENIHSRSLELGPGLWNRS